MVVRQHVQHVCVSVHSHIIHTVRGSLHSGNFEFFGAVELRIPFVWDMPRCWKWVIGSRRLEETYSSRLQRTVRCLVKT
jgi:hypothetical protein